MIKQEEPTAQTSEIETADLPEPGQHPAPDLTRRNIGEIGSNEKYIQAVLDIEKQADAIYEKAVREAEQIPKLAEQEAEAILEKARKDAQDEAHRIVTGSHSQEESGRILTEAEDKIRRMKNVAASRIDLAVGCILDQVAGKE